MKRKFLVNVLTVVLLVLTSVFCFVGCGVEKEESDTVSLDVTEKQIVIGESFTLNATVTPSGAEVVWSTSNESVATVVDGTVLGVSEGEATITVTLNEVSASCNVTVKAEKFTVTFKNGNEVLKEEQVVKGQATSYVGVSPSKQSTDQYAYSFIGWALTEDGDPVDLATLAIEENTVLHAVFSQDVREYVITWDIDGATTTDNVLYGEVPAYIGTTPTKQTVGNTSYTFLGWATSLTGEVLDEIPAVSGNATYYAIFEEVTAQTVFTVTWMNGTTVLETDENVEFEATPDYSGATPTKESTAENDFTFAGWATSDGGEKLDVLPLVSANVTYYAVFTATAHNYTITWVIEGEESTTSCAWGTVPAFDGNPVKADSEDCSYKFDGWALTADGDKVAELPVVSGEAIYYAVFVVDQVFEIPKFVDGQILVSDRTLEVFMPEGLVPAGATISTIDLVLEDADDVLVYENGEWDLEPLLLTEEEWKGNLVGVRSLKVRFDGADRVFVDMYVYAGVIDELADFPAFFNNTAVPSEFDPVAYPAVAPNTYGYYVITTDLGTGAEELALTQTLDTDYQKTNGFNGVLDGQGHKLQFKLTSGGLVGMVLGNAVIKNVAIIYEDGTYDESTRKGGYGVFGYITNGAPEIRNCYIERTNNFYHQGSVFGLMGRPNSKLILRNTVVYAFNTSNTSGWHENMWISEASENSYLIHARANATEWGNVKNFTKVFNDAVENGSRDVLLSEVENADGFDNKYWLKENGKLIWKGFETATVTWVRGDETIVELATKGSKIPYTQTLPEGSISDEQIVSYYWSLSEDGAPINFSQVVSMDESAIYYFVEKIEIRSYTVSWVINGETTTSEYAYGEIATHDDPVIEEDDLYRYTFLGWSLSEDGELVELGAVTKDETYYAVFDKESKITLIEVEEDILYSSHDDQLFIPTEIDFELDETVTISSQDGATVYFENGAWLQNFDLTEEQIKANLVGTFNVKIQKDSDVYVANVKSYAGVIDELADFPRFFNNTAVPSEFNPTYSAVAPNVYGYYIVIKDLGSYTGDNDSRTYADDLSFDQVSATDYEKTNGFNGVLDGAGHTLKFNLKKGGLVGMVLGNATIKNLAVVYADSSFVSSNEGGNGVFGYITNGAPVIDNCYIERTNNNYQRASVFGIMGKPNAKLVVKNTLVYGFNCNHDATWWTPAYIAPTSENVYLICGRSTADTFVMATNFTKVYTNGSGDPNDTKDGKKIVPLADIEDASGFNGNYWNKDTNVSWKGLSDMTFASVITVTIG